MNKYELSVTMMVILLTDCNNNVPLKKLDFPLAVQKEIGTQMVKLWQ